MQESVFRIWFLETGYFFSKILSEFRKKNVALQQYSAFDIAVYGQKHFGMYSGEEMTVTLRGTRAMVGVVLDRFGQDVILVPDGPEHFTVSIPLVLSPQFFGWLFALEPELTLVAPPQAVDQYRERLRLVQAQYRQDQ